jgi:hypothetical protein
MTTQSFYICAPDGQVTMAGTCPASMVSYQKVPGHSTHEGDAEVGVHYRKNGALKAKPPKPSPFCDFDTGTETWVPDSASAWGGVRDERNRLLQESDWTQLPDVPIDTKEAWATYRQALRDVTDQPDPFNIVWPVAPG